MRAKIDYIADTVLSPLWQGRLILRPKPGQKLAAWHGLLKSRDGLAGFMAAQIVADMKHVAPLNDAPDWWSFAASGPGSRRGLNRVLGRELDKYERVRLGEGKPKRRFMPFRFDVAA